MKTRKTGTSVCRSIGVGLLFVTISGWGNFTGYFPADTGSGHLAECGTSTEGVTAWTYARYYGPPARPSEG